MDSAPHGIRTTLSFRFSHTCSSYIFQKIVAYLPRNAAVGNWNVASTALVVMRYRSTVPFVQPVVIVSQTCPSLLRFPLFLDATVPRCVHCRIPTQKSLLVVCELGAGGTGRRFEGYYAYISPRTVRLCVVLLKKYGPATSL
jgi:hypothetical protein